MAVQALIKNQKFQGQRITAPLEIPAGTTLTKFWVNIDDVQIGAGTQRMWLEHSADGGATWQVLTTIEVEAPPSNAGRGLGRFDGSYYQRSGAFRLRYDSPGVVTLDASYEVTVG